MAKTFSHFWLCELFSNLSIKCLVANELLSKLLKTPFFRLNILMKGWLDKRQPVNVFMSMLTQFSRQINQIKSKIDFLFNFPTFLVLPNWKTVFLLFIFSGVTFSTHFIVRSEPLWVGIWKPKFDFFYFCVWFDVCSFYRVCRPVFSLCSPFSCFSLCLIIQHQIFHKSEPIANHLLWPWPRL